MISTCECRAILVGGIVLVILTVQIPRAFSEEANQQPPAKLPLSRESSKGAIVRHLPKSVEWLGREYDVDTGIDTLMSTVRDPTKAADGRHWGLMGLAMFRGHLEGHPCLDELARLYDNASDSHKGAILICFQASDDPRGIPLFIRTLDKEKNMKLRLSAAGALAHWNIRRGVAELVELLESKEILPEPARMLYVRDNALESFRRTNGFKGWGFPEKEWWKSIDGRADLDEDEKRALYNAEIEKEIPEIKKWFAENEHRFPDWKAGDPLPEVAPPESTKSAGE